MSTPQKIFRTKRRVEFRDTDAAGIMHFSKFFTYMEEVEHEFLRSLGTSVKTETAAGVISWPRVAAECDFMRPLRFEEVFLVELRVQKIGNKSVRYGFTFRTSGDEAVAATGAVTSVCCRVCSNAAPQSIAIPAELLQMLSPFAPAVG